MTISAKTTEQTEALVQRLFGAVIDTLELASVHIGGQLGFYRALADAGDATPSELASRTARPNATCASGSSSRRWPGSSP